MREMYPLKVGLKANKLLQLFFSMNIPGTGPQAWVANIPNSRLGESSQRAQRHTPRRTFKPAPASRIMKSRLCIMRELWVAHMFWTLFVNTLERYAQVQGCPCAGKYYEGKINIMRDAGKYYEGNIFGKWWELKLMRETLCGNAHSAAKTSAQRHTLRRTHKPAPASRVMKSRLCIMRELWVAHMFWTLWKKKKTK